MKKKQTPYLDFYKSCAKTGSIRAKITRDAKRWAVGGLCNTNVCVKYNEVFNVFDEGDGGYWGYENSLNIYFVDSNDVKYSFTPLRQTIVLFCAAMNNEL